MRSKPSTKKSLNLALVSFLVLQLSLGALTGRMESAMAASKPNLIVLMTDDLDIVTYRTALKAGLLPNINEHLVKKGVSFENSFVTNAVCCPSRATLLSGQYTKNHGVRTVFGGISYWLNGPNAGGESSTIATWLQSAGYRTVQVGKYLNGYGYQTARDYVPVGYNEWYALLDPSTYRVYGYTINENGTPVKYPDEVPAQYQTDVLTGKATGFIKRHFASSSAPFFMALTPIAPHIEVLNQTSPETEDLGYLAHFYESIRPAPRHQYLVDGNEANGEAPSLVRSPSFNHHATDTIEYTKNLPYLDDAAIAAVNSQFKHKIASMKAVDDMLGSVLASMTQAQLDNTVIVFTGDNGYFFGEHKLSAKLFGYEESIRVPLVIRGPGFAQGISTKKIALNNDLAPTLKELGLATGSRVSDGRSLVPILRNPAAPWTRKQFLVEHYAEGGGIAPDVGALLDLSPPTFKAVRRLTDTEDYLYVEWNEKVLKPNETTFFELFALNDTSISNARYQMMNQYPSVGSTQKSALQSTLSSFKACAGTSCQALEDK
jgi:N-acetylglucosamine-6-sulfatase